MLQVEEMQAIAEMIHEVSERVAELTARVEVLETSDKAAKRLVYQIAKIAAAKKGILDNPKDA